MKLIIPLFRIFIVLFSATAAHAAIIPVTTTNDSGGGSLSNAIATAQSGDTIRFNISGAGTHYIKTPEAGYPIIRVNDLTIDGYSQPGSSPNSNPILARNNAVLKIALDAREGPEQRLRLGTLGNPGFGDNESAILSVQGGKNFNLRGVSFVSRVTQDSDADPGIYCVALIDDAQNAHLNGNWFGLDPDGVTVTGGRSAVASFIGTGGTSSSGLVIGTDGDGVNDVAEFNISMAMEIAVHLETPDVKMSGNFINVYPSGTNFLDLSTATGGIEAIESGRGNNMIIGTDGDGVSDSNERNIFGELIYDTLIEFWRAATNVVFAGNYVCLGVDGQTTTTNFVNLINIRKESSIRIGSDFDGVSDELEGNWIYNLDRQFIGFHGSNNDGGGIDAAKISVRGNHLVNISSQILMQDQNVTIATYYSTVLADSAGASITTLTTNTAGTHLIVSIPPSNTNTYPTAIVDFYTVDPIAVSQNPLFVQGKTFLRSVIDGSIQDLDPNPNSVSIRVDSLGITNVVDVTALVTYSMDSGAVTESGRAVSGIFSAAVNVAPPSTITLGPVMRNGPNLILNWLDGTPPYQVERRTSLSPGFIWNPEGGLITTNSAIVPITGNQGYFRVRGQ